MPDVDFSHSGAVGGLAVSAHGKIAADIECLRLIDEVDALAQTILRRGATPHEAPLRLWGLKESVLKAAGGGLGIDPRAVRLDTGRLVTVLCGALETLTGVLPPCGGADDREKRIWLRPFVVAGGVAALALATVDGDGLAPVVQTDLAEADPERVWRTLPGTQTWGGGAR